MNIIWYVYDWLCGHVQSINQLNQLKTLNHKTNQLKTVQNKTKTKNNYGTQD